MCFRLPLLADLDILQVSLALYSLLREVIMMMQLWVKGKMGPERFFVANWAGVVRKIPKEQAPTLLLQKYKTHSQMLGKFEYTGGSIFKVVLEC